MTATVDLSGFNHDLRALLASLQDTGQGGDMHQLLRTEAGQLAQDISMAIGPKTKKAGTDAIAKDVRKSLSYQPREGVRFSPEQQFSTYPGFTWLAAGPNWLLGVKDEDDQGDASVAEALRLHYRVMEKHGRGKTYAYLGRQNAKAGSHQHIRQLNRYRVTVKTYRAVVAHLNRQVGQLRAAFARAAKELVPLKRIPGWVKGQIGNVTASGKSIFNPAGLNHPTLPWIEFGAAAAGVEKNRWIAAKIQSAVDSRAITLRQKAEKILAGHAYRWETGAVYRPKLED